MRVYAEALENFLADAHFERIGRIRQYGCWSYLRTNLYKSLSDVLRRDA